MSDSFEQVPEALREATALLRALPPVRTAWRETLLSQLEPPPRQVTTRVPFVQRRWRVSPLFAAAAALVFTTVGGLIGYRVSTSNAMRRPVNAQSISAPARTVASSNVSDVALRLELVAPTATHVAIVGDFNQWNPTSLPMRRSADGRTWEIEVRLAPGRYTYGFVVDGRVRRDPRAPQSVSDDFGIPSSVLMVHQAGGAL